MEPGNIEDDFRLGIQLCDGTECTNPGDIGYTPYLQDGHDGSTSWTAYTADDDAYDPNRFRIGIFGRNESVVEVYVEDIDIRFGIEVSDGSGGSNAGSIQYTPWASEGGGSNAGSIQYTP